MGIKHVLHHSAFNWAGNQIKSPEHIPSGKSVKGRKFPEGFLSLLHKTLFFVEGHSKTNLYKVPYRALMTHLEKIYNAAALGCQMPLSC